MPTLDRSPSLGVLIEDMCILSSKACQAIDICLHAVLVIGHEPGRLSNTSQETGTECKIQELTRKLHHTLSSSEISSDSP